MCLLDAMTGQNAGKTVAIILGGAAGVAFLIIMLLFARNLMKKHDGRCYTWLYGMNDFSITQLILYNPTYSYSDSVILPCHFLVQIIDSRRCFTVEAKFSLKWIVFIYIAFE